ncbi:hypothetical protein PVAND_010965 [Polypedilum vanderplanki]|uniref:Uncharacterized protein n=1 Tax=Polypedilum vanderplanki TaxID=319348 RepID=A0A9J6CI49_POLVA|nr:hypothetical protein PVAND_010965 [Polypedilum vanderplanki]
MICAQVEAEPPIAPQTSDIMHHDLVSLSNPTTTSVVANSAANIQSDLAAVTAANMCAITTQTPMMCEQNLLQIDAVSTQTPMLCEQNLLQIDAVNILPIATLDTNIENSTSATENTSLISNAVSDATAETQAVVKQMIATVTEQLLSENPTETQSTITSFISSTLVNDMVQAVSTEQAQQNQQQITDSQQQQIQEIIAQELLTPVTMINKDDNNGQAQNIQSNIITVAAATNTTRTLNQPFSPTPDFNLTTMSESDLISFINPSVFM